MRQPDSLEVAFAMQKYGGSFIKALASLIIVADQANLTKIRNTWPIYWAKYEKIAAKMIT